MKGVLIMERRRRQQEACDAQGFRLREAATVPPGDGTSLGGAGPARSIPRLSVPPSPPPALALAIRAWPSTPWQPEGRRYEECGCLSMP